MKKTIKLEAEIDMSKVPNETRVKSIDGDCWDDFGYWLEVIGFMTYTAMKYREWDEDKIVKYIDKYIRKCIADYGEKLQNTDTK